MALKIPTQITNLPQQPVFPSRIIQTVTNIANWWSPHEEDMVMSGGGLQTIRPVVGAKPLVQGGEPLTFPPVVLNGKTRKGAFIDNVMTKFLTTSLDLVDGWNSYILAVSVADITNAPEAGVIQFGSVGAFILYPFRSTNQTNGAAVSWALVAANGSPTGVETRIIETGGTYVDVNKPVYMIIGHHTVNGAVKASFNGGPVLTSATSPAALGGGKVATVELGRRSSNANHGFHGSLLNFGHVRGDLLADAASMVKLKTYMNALYGIAI